MKKSRRSHIPKFKSIHELSEFFETHDMGDYWNKMPKADFEIDVKKKTHVFALDDDLAEKLTSISKAKGIPSEQRVNVFLREKLLARDVK